MTTPLSSTILMALFVVLPAIMLLVLALIVRVFPGLWTATVGETDRFRIHSMDGARGLLSLWVVTHHLLMGSTVDANGVWHPPSGALGVLIESGLFIAPFFMLTAMLFGGRLLMSGGQIDTVPFLVRRGFRLVPAYLVAVALLVLAAFVISGFRLHVSIPKLLVGIIRWCLFDFVGRYDINGVDVTGAYGILWTLRYEILFYATLPVFGFLQRQLRNPLVLVFGLLAIGIFSWPFLYFAGGVVAGICTARLAGPRFAARWQGAAVAGIAGIIVAANFGIGNHLLQAVALIPLLVCLAQELPLVRPLAWRPLRFAGEVSYSTYVLHTPIIFLLSLLTTYSYMNAVHMPVVQRTVFLSSLGCASLAGAILCFVCVEKPCIRLGGALARRLRGREAAVGVRPENTPAASV